MIPSTGTADNQSFSANLNRAAENLEQALELLREAKQELNQFARLTSHDLKTPLGTVVNLCDEVIDEFGKVVPAEARTMIQNARQTAFRMSGLIDQFLAIPIPKDGGLPGAKS